MTGRQFARVPRCPPPEELDAEVTEEVDRFRQLSLTEAPSYEDVETGAYL